MILLDNCLIVYAGISLCLVLTAYTMRIPPQSPCELHCFLSPSERKGDTRLAKEE